MRTTPEPKVVAVVELRCGRIHTTSGIRCKGRFNSYMVREDGSTGGTIPAVLSPTTTRVNLPNRKMLSPADDPEHMRQVNLSDLKTRRRMAPCPRCSASYVLTEATIAKSIRAAAARGKKVAYLAELT